MKTYSVKPSDIKRQWVLIDATDKTVGRLSTEVARLLRGKHKTCFVPHLDCVDTVIVINADKVKFTGEKWKDKVYYSYSGYIGGMRATLAQDLLSKHPERVLSYAIKGMLPHTKLGRAQIKNLKVYAGAEHPHKAQTVVAAAPRLLSK